MAQGDSKLNSVNYSFYQQKRKEVNDATTVRRTKKKRIEVEDVGEDNIRNGHKAKMVKNMKSTLKVKRGKRKLGDGTGRLQTEFNKLYSFYQQNKEDK